MHLVRQAGSNWPLRGQKFRTYEGGTRVPGFLHSEMLPAAARGTEYSGMFHLVRARFCFEKRLARRRCETTLRLLVVVSHGLRRCTRGHAWR